MLGSHEPSLLSHRSYVFVPDFIIVTWVGAIALAAVSLAPPQEAAGGPLGMCVGIVL